LKQEGDLASHGKSWHGKSWHGKSIGRGGGDGIDLPLRGKSNAP